MGESLTSLSHKQMHNRVTNTAMSWSALIAQDEMVAKHKPKCTLYPSQQWESNPGPIGWQPRMLPSSKHALIDFVVFIGGPVGLMVVWWPGNRWVPGLIPTDSRYTLGLVLKSCVISLLCWFLCQLGTCLCQSDTWSLLSIYQYIHLVCQHCQASFWKPTSKFHET